MKRNKILFVGAVLVLTLPIFVGASTMWSGNRFTLPLGEVKEGNAYLIAQNELIAGIVTGDLVTAGERVIITGAVNEDVLAAGESIQLTGVVGGDARVAGSDVLVLGTISGDLAAAGSRIYGAPGSSIGGDVVLLGGDITLEGVINGNVRIFGGRVAINGSVSGTVEVAAGKLALGEYAAVGGDLTFRGPQAPVIAPGAVIAGKTNYVRDNFGSERFEHFARGAGAVATTVALAMALVITLLFFGLFKRQAVLLTHEALSKFWSSAGSGLVAFLFVAIISVLAIITVIGIPVGIFGFLSLGATSLLACALYGVIFGTWAMRVIFKRRDYQPSIATALWGALAVRLLAFIPVVGGLVNALFFLLAFGVLAHAAHQRFWVHR